MTNIIKNLLKISLILLLINSCVSKIKYKSHKKVNVDNINISKVYFTPEIPQFNLPPPMPSAFDQIDDKYFNKYKNLNEVNKVISNSLNKCGYDRKGYYSVQNGFALVTQLENINEDGTVKPESERWNLKNIPHMNSISDYFNSLVKAQPGYYRCIVFVITDSYYNFKPPKLSKEQTDSWLATGLNKLPDSIGNIPISDKFTYTALIYQFKKNESEENYNLVYPSSISGSEHLKKIKFYFHLTN